MQTLKIQKFASVSKTVEANGSNVQLADFVCTTGGTQTAHGLWINLE